jgi:copper homeostasis protein
MYEIFPASEAVKNRRLGCACQLKNGSLISPWPRVGECFQNEWSCPQVFMMNYLFELCAETEQAAQAAQSGGATRIELCSQLSIGGVTPSEELTTAVIRALSIPVHVLIRPRGGDFVYSPAEFDRMRQQIEHVKQAGAAGIAVGVLLPDGHVDVERSRELISLARPLSVTFHRAFDETVDVNDALESVIHTGADCLLTSGGAPDVLTGANSIARLRRQAAGRLEIMAGGGLRLANLAEVVRLTGVTYLHGSLTRKNVAPTPADTENNGNHSSNGHAASHPPPVLVADVREAIRLLSEEVAAMDSAVHSTL